MSRRNLPGGLAVLATAPAAVAMAAPSTRRASTPRNRRSGPNPDAELIRVCEAHPAILAALDEHGSGADDCPLWLAYERSRDAIHAAVPLTLAGMVAKARAAKAEVRNPDGPEDPAGTPGATWSWDLLNDLLRLEGGA